MCTVQTMASCKFFLGSSLELIVMPPCPLTSFTLHFVHGLSSRCMSVGMVLLLSIKGTRPVLVCTGQIQQAVTE